MTSRKPDWETALSEFIGDCADKPFVYGEHDCAMFAANAVVAVTGTDPIPKFRGKYSTQTGSIKALKRYGAGTLESTIDSKFEVKPASNAIRGDLAFYEGSVGVVMGGFAVFVGENDKKPGLVKVPRADWEKAWSVG